ncbi:hypothetical protein LW4_022 [Lactococcus phage LW4]|uniref:Uncharacterized protein n=4 Tax=Teubervirus LW31 TaxID=2845420 RepID=A0A1W6JHT5_9CAUD|nr:hypothetical protein H1N70_gp21 [Lactococcus phage LW31]ARM65623.1 hypothetical protein LW31_021 [Lactococcus phage LW31]ARM65708.1 hypothetical protein LW32_021 [Lactococcus phage LW32]ARM65796.1 hypothetical protein LW33_022 [Lactococcus phage LW33]ARM65882.1 hypothetical protein LW4_022 [Lactococcus phage LW4]
MTKKELTKLKIKAMLSVFVYYFWYVFSVVQGIDTFTSIFFTGENIIINILFFVLSILWLAFSIYIRDKLVKAYKDAKSQNEI